MCKSDDSGLSKNIIAAVLRLDQIGVQEKVSDG